MKTIAGCRQATPFTLRCVRISTRRITRAGWRGDKLRFAVLASKGSSSSKEAAPRCTPSLPNEEEIVQEEKTTPDEIVHETVAADPPKWSDAFLNRNFGPWVLGGIISSLAVYLIYLVFIKDRTMELNRLDTDLKDVTSKLQRLKEIRMEPDMSDTDIIRVRSFLLSLMIKQRKQDPVKVINSALSLLGERHMNKKEKKLVLGFDERLRPQTPDVEEESASSSDGLSFINVEPAPNKHLTSIAFSPDASVFWWHKLPYICVLQMKRSRAVFMTAVTGRGDDSFALVGFEDPEEAFHAGKMPIHEQFWGLLSAIKDGTALPTRPLEDEKHFDLTWLHPKEFNALIESVKCYGLVIPAGTLRSKLINRPVLPHEIKPAIDRICLDKKIGATKAQTSELDAIMDSSDNADGEDDSVVRSFEEDGVDLLQPEEETTSKVIDSTGTVQQEEKTISDFIDVNGILQEEEDETALDVANSNGALQQEDEKTSDMAESNGSLKQEELKGISANDQSSVMPQEQLPSKSISESNGDVGNGASGELFRNRPLSAENANATKASSSETVSLNGASSPADETATADSSDLWWMSLDSVIIPKIKPGGQEGGNVEINISIDPDVTDFRPILFEDEREAKGFLGILGQLHGPETLVATVAQSPREFLDENTKLKRDQIVVLCTGSLLLNRDADRNAVRNAIRMAHVATEIKKGVSSAPENGVETDFDKRVKKVAEDVVSNFKDRLDSNIRSQSRPGDAAYKDPLDGLMHDLEHGGVEELLGLDSDDGISAKVGEDGQKGPFPGGYFGGQNDPGEKLYEKFAARMTEGINKARENVRNAAAPSSAPSSQSNHAQEQELNVSLDALIREKEVEEEKEFEKMGDGIEVIYPDDVKNDEPKATGSRWFRELDAIFVPTYLTPRGLSTYMVMSDTEENKTFVIAFQDRKDAMACKEIMKSWEDKEYIAAGIEMVPPHTLLNFCEECNVIPVVIRSSSVPLTVGMTQSDFLNKIGTIARVQTTNYPIFKG